LGSPWSHLLVIYSPNPLYMDFCVHRSLGKGRVRVG
jgi:hypothetical protein